MNAAKTLQERQQAVRELLQQEVLLLKQGYNPFNKKLVADTSVAVFDANLNFANALPLALKNLKAEKKTITDITSVMKRCITSANILGIDFYPVTEIKKKHLRLILENCSSLSTKFTANTYNHYRKYLSILFTELCQYEIIDSNPVKDLLKQKTIKRTRNVLSDAEATAVNDFLFTKHYSFWRFVQIFFASGSRIKGS